MFESHSQVILELCRDHALVPSAALHDAHVQHQITGQPLADLLVQRGLVDLPTLLSTVATHLGLRYVASPPTQLPDELIHLVPAHLARTYVVVPVHADAHHVELLAANPFDAHAVEDLAFALGREITLHVADPATVHNLRIAHYGADAGEHRRAELPDATATPTDAPSTAEIETLAAQAPIIHFVNLVLGQAIRDHASDIHFEPFEHEFKIRYRIDGALYEMSPPPKHLALPIASRLKVLANLNIAERRLPQDGRLKLTLDGRSVDLRVSTLPTQFGESIVLRVLDQAAVRLELTQLGLPPDVLADLQETIHRPNGILIVTGPTGSGKTTTLYSALRIINQTDLKLLTAEDPVEYEIDGIMQVPVNHGIGLTFASALRAFLRQDPDVIMLGEIRDLETAQVAIQASLTGHLVLSTLHTNDAAGAVTRLIDMGVEPFLIASALEAVLAQRLVRRICPQCRTAYRPTPALLAQLNLSATTVGERCFYYGRGCAQCHHTGYHGRLGLYEWLRLTDPLRDLIIARAPTHTLRQKALEEGLRLLRSDGLRALFDGATTAEEILKYT